MYVTGKAKPYGELGLGNTQQVLSPVIINGLENETFIDISCSTLHTLAINKNGQIWSWGCNEYNALGRTGDTTYPQPITHPSIKNIKFKKVACGNSVSLAITTKHQLYAWGKFNCKNGDYGFLPNVEHQDYPYLLRETAKLRIVDIAAGASHCLALDIRGHVYSWGCGEFNQLGYDTSQDWESNKQCLIPTKLQLQDIISIQCGAFHSIALGALGQVYTWGLNHFQQCGQYDPDKWCNEKSETIVQPTLLPYFKKKSIFKLTKKPLKRKRLADEAFTSEDEKPVVFRIERSGEPRAISVAAGDYHSMALMSNNTLVVWGQCGKGQLGIPLKDVPGAFTKEKTDEIYAVGSPIRNEFNFKESIREVQCGSNHTIVLSKAGTVFGFGESGDGQLGMNSEVKHTEIPIKVKNINEKGKVLHVGTGGDVTFFLVNNEGNVKNT